MSIATEFEEHCQRYPLLLTELIREALKQRAAGIGRMSFRWIWEEVRRSKPGLAPYDDHLHSRYSRLVMESERSLAGMFPTRRLRSN
jgi:hypothetical protein